MTAKTVLDQERREVQRPQDELFELVVSAVDSQSPFVLRPGSGGLENLVAEVEHVDPVQELAFAVSPCFDSLELTKELGFVCR